MVKRVALAALVVSTVAIAIAYAAAFARGGPPAWAAWCLAMGTAVCMVSLLALGAARDGRSLGRLRVPFALTLLIVAGGFALALALPAEGAGAALWLGLPRRAAIVMYGIGLLPLFVLPYAYASTFDEMTLSDDDLARVRAAAAAMRGDPVDGAAEGLRSGVGAGADSERGGPPAAGASEAPLASAACAEVRR